MTDFVKPKLPFKIVSSSVDTSYMTEISSGFKPGVDIVGHHQDTYAGLENEPLQSPFTKEHVGGNQHRHVPLNHGGDNDFNRPESFKIKPENGQLKIYGPDFESIDKPRAQNWLGAKSPINIQNVQNSGNVAGNFGNNYEVVQSVGRRTTNNLIVDGFIASGNLTTQFISGAHNYTLPNIVNNSDSIIVERFNSPGGKEESSRGALDRVGEEMSPNNSLITRNIKARQPFYSQLTQHMPQFGSGSTYALLPSTGNIDAVSIHKINRNSRKLLSLEQTIETPAIAASYVNGDNVFTLTTPGSFGNEFSFSVLISQPSNSIVVIGNTVQLNFSNSEEIPVYSIESLINNASNWPDGNQLFTVTWETAIYYDGGPFNFSGGSDTVYSEEIAPKNKYDNFWIQHNIPANKFGYSWITASSISNPYTNGTGSLEFAFTSSLTGSSFIDLNTQTLSFEQGDVQLYATYAVGNDLFTSNIPGLAGNNLILTISYAQPSNSITVDGYNVTLNFSLMEEVTAYDVSNLINNPANWPDSKQLITFIFDETSIQYYGDGDPYNFSGAEEPERVPYFEFYGTREQIRTSEHPVARKLKENNIIAVENQTVGNVSLQTNSLNVSKRSGTSTNFREPLITNKNYPLQQELRFAGEPSSSSTKLKYTFKNNSSRFANEDLDTRLGLTDKVVDFYDKLVKANKLEQNSPISDILSITFKETLYPKELNTFLSEVRNREAYILNQPGTGSDGYDRRLSSQRVIWRDKQEDRRRTKNSDGGHTGSLGYSSVLQSGSSFYIEEETFLANEEVAIYTSSFSASVGLDTNLFNSISVLENSSSQLLAYTSSQIATFGGKTIFNKKQSDINSVAGELNEQFVDSYGVSSSVDGLLENGFGSIYRRSYYKSVTQQPPYVSGSISDTVDSVVVIPTEDNEIQINPKPRYLAFLGGTQIIKEEQDVLDKFNNPAENLFENEISNIKVVYSTIDNGLLRKTEELSGKKPFFDSYEEFISDARVIGQDYSIIPEFRISQHMKYYVSSSGGNFRNKNNTIFEIDGNGISNRSALTEKSNFNIEFKDKYLNADELENNQIIEQDYSEDISQNSVSFTIKGVKKLLPYNGFYPQDRILQLANLYSEYAESNLVGGLYNVSYEENTRDDKILAHIDTTSSLNSVSSISSVKFSSSLDGECFYIAVGHHNFDSNRGSVKVFKSTTDSPFTNWNQESVIQYTGSTTNCYFGQSVLLTTGSNVLNLFITEFGQNRTGSIYHYRSSDGITGWTGGKITNITGSTGTYFGNYLDGLRDSSRTVLAITETGVPIAFNGTVRATYLSGTDLYIGGNFTRVNGDPTLKYLVKLNTTSSTNEISGNFFASGGGGDVYVLTGSGNRMFVGGAFSSIGGLPSVSCAKLAAYDISNKAWIDAKLGKFNGNVNAIHVSGSDLYVGGNFNIVTDMFGSSKNVLRILRIFQGATSNVSSSTNYLPLGKDFVSSNNGVNSEVKAIHSSGSDIYIGGNFTQAFSGSTIVDASRIAKWNNVNNIWSPIGNLSTTITQFSNSVGGYFSGSNSLNKDEYFGGSCDISSDGKRFVIGAPGGDVLGGNTINLNNVQVDFSGTLSDPRSLFMSPNGQYLFISYAVARQIVTYEMSVPYKISTATYLRTSKTFPSGHVPLSTWFNSSGNTLFISRKVSSTTLPGHPPLISSFIDKYSLSTPWNINTTGSATSYTLQTLSTTPTVVAEKVLFSPDGKKMFISNYASGSSTSGNSEIRTYTLGTAFDIAGSVSYSNSIQFSGSLSSSTKQNKIRGFWFDNSGKQLIVCGEEQDRIIKANLSIGYNLTSSVTFSSILISSDNLLQDVFILDYNKYLYILGDQNDKVYQHNLYNDAGEVYVYDSGSSGWVESYLTSSTRDIADQFGYSVLITNNKNRIFVGSPTADPSSKFNAGYVTIFNSSSTGWSPENNVIAGNKDPDEYVGFSLAADSTGNRIAVSAPYGLANGVSEAGKVFIYNSSSVAGWTEEVIDSPNIYISASDRASGDAFGDTIAMNSAGNRLVASAPFATVGGIPNAGKVYIFNSSSGVGGGWKQESIGANVFISASDKGNTDLFGWGALAINSTGNRIVIGSALANVSGKDDAGKVYIFNSSSGVGGGWKQEAILTASDGLADDRFGSSVDINFNGNVVVVGAPGASFDSAINTGKVYLFISESYGWVQRTVKNNSFISASDRTADSFYGQRVSIDSNGNSIVVGSPYSAISVFTQAGKSYLYSSSLSGWEDNIAGGLNNTVNDIKLSGTDLYIGGAFTINSEYNKFNRIVKYSPTSNLFIDMGSSNFDNSVLTLKISGSVLYAGGSFTSPGKYVAKWNGTTWSSLTANFLNNDVYNINFSSSNLYAGGNFTAPSTRFGIYNLNTSTWLSSDGKVHIITASNLNPNTWSSKTTVISGANLAKYCSIVGTSNGYHIYTTDQSDDRGAIRVVSSSDGGVTWSSGALGGGLIIRSGSSTTSELGNLPIDATVFTPTSGPSSGQERVYLFTADKGTSGNGSFFVFSSSINSNWNGISPVAGTSNSKIIKQGTSTEQIVLADYNKNVTNINISSLTASNVLYYAFGVPSATKVYVGRSYDGQTFESEENLYTSQPSTRTTSYGENIDISNITNTIPVFFTNDFINIYSIVKGKFVIYRLNIENYEKYVKHASLEPVFAPGILYNTIKSGIAVDWPCTTGSNVIVKSSGSYGLRSAFYPKNLTMKTLDTEEGILNAQGSLKSNINYRIPFENIIFPNELFEPKQEIKTNQYTLRPIDSPDISSNDVVNQYLNKSYIYSGYEPYIDPLEVTDLANLGPKRYSSPFVYRKLQTSDSGLYTLSVSNFLAETIKFFLRDQKLVTFNSLPDNKWKEFDNNKTYYMDVVLEKSPDLVMIEAYSSSAGIEPRDSQTFNGRYFGYPTNKTFKNVWTGSAFTLEESSQIHSDPAYAPYTPPYFEGIARARISFKPSVNGRIDLETLLRECEVQNIFTGIENGAHTGSDAYIEKMPINSSVDLRGSAQAVNVTIRNDSSGQEISEDPNNKIWIISPKMETPVLDFSSQEFEEFQNSYIKNSGYGRGMWSGYGEIPTAGKGIRLRIEYPFARIENEQTASLLEQVGFLAEEKNVGKIAENKIISEAIVVVPYLQKETDRTVKNKTSFKESNMHFIKINKTIFNEQRKNVENQTEQEQQNSIADMIQKMKNYVIPPEMNFLEYSDLQPHVMYLFEFTHTLDQQDLADVWQGLMPKISLNPEKDEITINHEFNKNELFGEEGLPSELKFLVFKVKKKAEYNYFNVTATTKDDNRFQFNKIIGRKQGTDIYSYNWPYDYFSLVELAKLDIKINYKKKEE
jgi:hypothetical protein